MPSPKLEAEIDQLFKLPPDQFTAARNALARRAGGADASQVRAIPRPTRAAWAVNQLYWRERKTFEHLLKSAEKLLRAQKSAMTGGRADVREAKAAHRLAVQAAEARVMALFEVEGQPATAATLQAVLQILEALPGGVEPGRLTSTLKPTGFEVFADIDTIAPVRRLHSVPTEPKKRAPLEKAKSSAPPRRDRKASERAAKARAEDLERREKAKRARKDLAEARGRLRSAQAEARHAQTSAQKASLRLDRERAREEEARALHEKALERLAEAEAEWKRLRDEAESSAAMLRQAEEGVEGAIDPLSSKRG